MLLGMVKCPQFLLFFLLFVFFSGSFQLVSCTFCCASCQIHIYLYCLNNLRILINAARAEIGEFVEYDLDNEDEDWLEEFNTERKSISSEKYVYVNF